jgi:hypothetical protein
MSGRIGLVPKSTDTLLGHCVARAVMQDVVREAGGFEAVKAKYGENAERWSTWSKLRAVTKATPKASRVATFIVCWAIAMQEEGSDSYSITEYMRYWNENERKAYRVQNEFRELWEEYETPNELAQQILQNVRSRLAKKSVEKLPMTLQVSA